ncbi:MAG: 30S ribosomal protein S13 [archaeon]
MVRIAGKDLDGKKPICMALKDIKGIGIRFNRIIAITFEKETGIKFDAKLGVIPEDKDDLLEEIIAEPEKHGIPKWVLNRRKDTETGEDKHLIMADMDLTLRKDLQRMGKIQSYKGIRHQAGLPVRGQRTRTSFRKKGSTIGVVKKTIKGGK